MSVENDLLVTDKKRFSPPLLPSISTMSTRWQGLDPPAPARQETSRPRSLHFSNLRSSQVQVAQLPYFSFFRPFINPVSVEAEVPGHSHHWHTPVEVSREATPTPEARGHHRGRGRPVPTFYYEQMPVSAPAQVPQVMNGLYYARNF